MGQLLTDDVVVVLDIVVERQHQQGSAVLRTERVVRGLVGSHAVALGQSDDGTVRGRFVVGRVAQHEDLIEHAGGEAAETLDEQAAALDVVLGEDRRSDVGLAKFDDSLVDRQFGDCLVRRLAHERMTGLPSDEHAEGTPGDLRVQLGSVLTSLERRLHLLLPEIRRAWHLEHGEGDRLTGLSRKTAHPFDLLHRRHEVEPGGTGRREFEDTSTAVAQGTTHCEEFVLGGEGARHRFAVHRRVGDRARGRHTKRARLDRLSHDRGHLFDVVGVGGFVLRASLPHHVGADCAMRNLRADIDGPAALVEGVEVFGERLPREIDAFGEGGSGNVLYSLHQLDEPLLGAGLHRREPDATVAHDECGDAMQGARLEQLVPRRLTVVVRVHVDEAGGDEQTLGIDDLVRLAEIGTDGDDAAVGDCDVGDAPVGASAVDNGAVGDQQIEHVAMVRPGTDRVETHQQFCFFFSTTPSV